MGFFDEMVDEGILSEEMMRENSVEIDVEMIEENELNKDRSMVQEEIVALAYSILDSGLIQPLDIYKTENDKYKLISGHRRLNAIKYLLSHPELGYTSLVVACTIHDAPNSTEEEIELLSQANIHRNKIEDLAVEINIISKAWEKMDESRKQELTQIYKNRFIENNENNIEYQSNPSEFLRKKFRAKLEYIRIKTGLSLSNRYLYKLIASVCDIEEEKVKKANIVGESEGNNEAPAMKKVSFRSVNKAFETAVEKMMAFMDYEEIDDYDLIEKITNAINEFREKYSD